MSDAFNTALQQAKQMYRPERQDISVVEIQLGMAGGGGLYPLIKRQGGGYARDPGGSGPWDAWSPPDEPQIQYQPVPQQATVPDISSGMMRSYFQNLVGEEEEGYNPLYRKEGGGLSSIQKKIDIGGEPHRLSYINSDEASLLKQLGGSGRDVNGVPAYYFGDTSGDFGGSWDDPGDMDLGSESAWSDVAANEVEQAAAIASIAAGEFDPGGGISINPLTMQEDAVELAAAQAVDARADAAAIAQQEAYTWGWGMYGTPEEEEAIIAAALDREAASKQAAEDLMTRDMLDEAEPTSLDAQVEAIKDKAAYREGLTTKGSFESSITVYGKSPAEMAAMLKENPHHVYENIELNPDGSTGATTYHSINSPYGFGGIQTQQGRGIAPGAIHEGMQAGHMVGEGQEFENYADALGYTVDLYRSERQKEQDELDLENITRKEQGLPPLLEPKEGFVTPELHESHVFDLANWAIQTGSGKLGALLNFLQRGYKGGEFDQEVVGWKDIMDMYNYMGILTGQRGPQYMSTYMGEKGTPDPEFSESLPEGQPQTPQQKKKEEEIKKLSLMAKFFEEDDEDKKKKIWDGFTQDEKDLIETLYGEKGLPSLMDQIG